MTSAKPEAGLHAQVALVVLGAVAGLAAGHLITRRWLPLAGLGGAMLVAALLKARSGASDERAIGVDGKPATYFGSTSKPFALATLYTFGVGGLVVATFAFLVTLIELTDKKPLSRVPFYIPGSFGLVVAVFCLWKAGQIRKRD